MLLKKNRIYINKLKAAKVPVLVAGLLVGISIFGVFVLNTSSVKASHALPANALLPDLVTHLSEQNNEGNGNTFNVDIVVSDGKRLFRLDNNIVNYSTGVLELRPVG
ncbi:MAG TPA: hypothetical protein VK983_05705, partial [Candidatus Limnocylindrales bacterium]|nr:hypothetical protein [Candidatus Limnocylindrales bacterium]